MMQMIPINLTPMTTTAVTGMDVEEIVAPEKTMTISLMESDRNSSCNRNQSNGNDNNQRNPQGDDNHCCQPCDDRLQTATALLHADCAKIAATMTFSNSCCQMKENSTSQDLAPTTVAVAKQVNNTEGRNHCKTFFDSGSTNNVVGKSSLPKDIQSHKLKTLICMDTANGN